MLDTHSIVTDGYWQKGVRNILSIVMAGWITLATVVAAPPTVGGGGYSRNTTKTDIYNKKKANEKQLLRLSITIDHVKYTEEKEVSNNIKVTTNNLTTNIDNSKSPRVSVYV